MIEVSPQMRTGSDQHALDCHALEFDGALLKRGFWLYVWRITSAERVFFYVGRTGDSSSDCASSPFIRLGRHLDDKPYARANTLHRNLLKVGVDSIDCHFEFFCVGPLHPEQRTPEDHRHHRDLVSRLEGALHRHFQAKGEVLGKPPRAEGYDPSILERVVCEFESKMSHAPASPKRPARA